MENLAAKVEFLKIEIVEGIRDAIYCVYWF